MYIKVAAVISALILSGCSGPTEVTTQSKPTVTPASISGSTLATVRNAVRERMKDPTSVRFGQYKALRLTNNEDQSSTIAVCGKYNAKNSYGGYAGEQMFLAKQLNDGRWSVVAGGMGLMMCSGSGFAVTVGGDFI